MRQQSQLIFRLIKIAYNRTDIGAVLAAEAV